MRVEYSAVIAKAMGFEYRYPLPLSSLGRILLSFTLITKTPKRHGAIFNLVRQYLKDKLPAPVYNKNQKIGGILPATMDKCNRYLAEGKFDAYFKDLPFINEVKTVTPRSALKNPMMAYMLKYYRRGF
jgi:hypothetical protein